MDSPFANPGKKSTLVLYGHSLPRPRLLYQHKPHIVLANGKYKCTRLSGAQLHCAYWAIFIFTLLKWRF
jgi:hypothetical protein